MELLAILSTINVVEHQRKKAVFALLNEENKKVCDLVIKYFIQEEFEPQQQLTLWRKLLAYREDMVQTYGDRVSLHIACYHLTRDPDSLEEVGLPSLVRCTRNAQALAIQELKAWWERCSESGAHLKEVMNEQLERMVYRANKNHQVLSFVLIKIKSVTKEVIDTEKRSAFARHLMDSCRCRDIVGHYEKGLLAIVFPQTPAEGAKIAIGRVSQFFHEKFGQQNYVWQVAIASCPDNGVSPQELVLMAEDRLSKMKKSSQDTVESCEGKASKLYLNYAHYIKQPVLQILASPIKTAMAILIFAMAIAAMLKVSGSNADQWKVELEQVMNEHQVFPDWTWGRGDSDAFDLEFVDGFVSHSNEYILEDMNEHWLSIPDSKSDRVRLDFKIWMSALSELKIYFGEIQQSTLSLEMTTDLLQVKQADILLYEVEYSSIVDDYVELSVEWGDEEVHVFLAGESILPPSWLPIKRESGGRIYFKMESGYALLSELKLSGKKDEQAELVKNNEIMTRLVSAANGKTAEKVQQLISMQGENDLVQKNLEELLLEYFKNPAEQRPGWVMKIITHPSMREFCLKNLSEVYQIAPNFTKGLEGIPGWLKEPPINLKDSQQKYDSLPANEELRFLKMMALKKVNYDDKKWLRWTWKQLVQNSPRDPVDRIQLFLTFFIEVAHFLDVEDVKPIFLQLGHLASKNNLEIYYGLKKYLEKLDESSRNKILDFDYIEVNPVLQLLYLQYMPEGESKIECIERISLDIGKTNFGKVLCYEWMWYSVQGVEDVTREERSILESLSKQNRRPKLAGLALEKLER